MANFERTGIKQLQQLMIFYLSTRVRASYIHLFIYFCKDDYWNYLVFEKRIEKNNLI